MAPQRKFPLFGIVDLSDQHSPKVWVVFDRNDVVIVPRSGCVSWAALNEGSPEPWNDDCSKCGRAGKVLCCFECNLVYHDNCLVSPILGRVLRSEEELLCPECATQLWENKRGVLWREDTS
jgi:hypothetical protein